MQIRPLRSQDNKILIASIYEASWKHAYKGIIPDAYLQNLSASQWTAALDNPTRHSLVMEDNGNFIGTCAYGAFRQEPKNGCGEIIALYLLPEYIGKGYGKALLQAAIEKLSEVGYKDILLWVLEENRQARGFYENFGFHSNGIYTTIRIGGKDLQEMQYVMETGYNCIN